MIKTTCIGACPKPSFVNLPDWFNAAESTVTSEPTKHWAEAIAQMAPMQRNITRGVAESDRGSGGCGP